MNRFRRRLDGFPSVSKVYRPIQMKAQVSDLTLDSSTHDHGAVDVPA